jgi:hypothetical protein
MPLHNFSTYADPLDLLRRFVPAPLKAMYRIGATRVMVQTNDFTLLPTALLGAGFDKAGGWDVEWKLVRDADSVGPLATPRFLTSEALTVVEMGNACMVGVDRERRELLAFIGRDVDARTYQEFLVPFLCRMMNDRSGANDMAGFAPRNAACAND